MARLFMMALRWDIEGKAIKHRVGLKMSGSSTSGLKRRDNSPIVNVTLRTIRQS